MGETLVRRVRRVVTGGIQSLVGAVESKNAEAMLREVLRETEQIIDEVRDEHVKIGAVRHQTVRQIERTRKKHSELGEKARLAVEQKRDDLAEAALSRQLDLEANLPILDATLAESSAKQRELEGYIAVLNGRKREMEDQLAAFLEARATTPGGQAASSPEGVSSPTYINASERRAEKAFEVFDRIMHNAAGVQGPAAPSADTSSKLIELERLSRSGEIADRLARIKSAAASAG